MNTQKSLESLCTNKEASEKEIKVSMPLTTVTKRMNCLGINLPKDK